MDSDVGRIIALLKNLGLDSNTAVFFTSDNGPYKGVSTYYIVSFITPNRNKSLSKLCFFACAALFHNLQKKLKKQKKMLDFAARIA